MTRLTVYAFLGQWFTHTTFHLPTHQTHINFHGIATFIVYAVWSQLSDSRNTSVPYLPLFIFIIYGEDFSQLLLIPMVTISYCDPRRFNNLSMFLVTIQARLSEPPSQFNIVINSAISAVLNCLTFTTLGNVTDC